MKRIDQEVERVIASQYVKGKRFMWIVREYKIGTSTLARILQRNGIQARHRCPFTLSSAELEAAIQFYGNGLTCKEIARKLRTSEFIVWYSLTERVGLKLRRTGYRVVPVRHRKNTSLRFRSLWADENYRQAHLAILARAGFKQFSRFLPPSDYRPKQPAVVELRAAVFARDKYKCRHCGSEERLQIHHKKPWRDFPNLRFRLRNVITLCISCHMRLEARLKRGLPLNGLEKWVG